MGYMPRAGDDARYVEAVGDTMTGDLTIDRPVGTVSRVLFRNSNGLPRWSVGKTADAETGGNTGSKFSVTAFDDSGTVLGELMSSDRTTGISTYPFGLRVNNQLIRDVADPMNLTDAANKQFVENAGPNGGGRGGIISTVCTSGTEKTLSLTSTYLNWVSLASNTLTVSKAGWWLASCRAQWGTVIPANVRAFVGIKMAGIPGRNDASFNEVDLTANCLRKLAVNDTIIFSFFHTVGSDVTVTGYDWHVKYLGNE